MTVAKAPKDVSMLRGFAADPRKRRLVLDADMAVSAWQRLRRSPALCGRAAYAALDLGALLSQLLQDHPQLLLGGHNAYHCSLRLKPRIPLQITQDRTAQPPFDPKLVVAYRCPDLEGGDAEGAQALRELVHLCRIGDLFEQHGSWRLCHNGDHRNPGD
jgi:hypothetical protein